MSEPTQEEARRGYAAAMPASKEPASPPTPAPPEADRTAGDDDAVEREAAAEDQQVDGVDSPDTAVLAAVTAERDEYLDQLQRSRAEFQNLRRRSAEEIARAKDDGARALLDRLLGVLDNFGYVIDAIEDDDASQLAKGVRMVHADLVATLQAAGLEPIAGAGATFDPTVHDALMSEEAEGELEQPLVTEVFRPGYTFRGRTLRPASVKVAH